MRCHHETITDYQCEKCHVPTFTKCTHPLGEDHAGFCKVQSCGQEVRQVSSNTLKQELPYVAS